MMINIFFIIIILLCLGGILFIIAKRMFYLANIDLDKIPQEIAAKTKKELLKKRIDRQLSNYKNNLKDDFINFTGYVTRKTSKLKPILKKVIVVVKDIVQRLGQRLRHLASNALDFFKKLTKIVKKRLPR